MFDELKRTLQDFGILRHDLVDSNKEWLTLKEIGDDYGWQVREGVKKAHKAGLIRRVEVSNGKLLFHRDEA
jgi:hypothetical protein